MGPAPGALRQRDGRTNRPLAEEFLNGPRGSTASTWLEMNLDPSPQYEAPRPEVPGASRRAAGPKPPLRPTSACVEPPIHLFALGVFAGFGFGGGLFAFRSAATLVMNLKYGRR